MSAETLYRILDEEDNVLEEGYTYDAAIGYTGRHEDTFIQPMSPEDAMQFKKKQKIKGGTNGTGSDPV